MSFFSPAPKFDFATSNGSNCLPWRGRADLNTTKHDWSPPYPIICSHDTADGCEEVAHALCCDPFYLVLGISPATCAVGPKGIEVWSLTLIVQRQT